MAIPEALSKTLGQMAAHDLPAGYRQVGRQGQVIFGYRKLNGLVHVMALHITTGFYQENIYEPASLVENTFDATLDISSRPE